MEPNAIRFFCSRCGNEINLPLETAPSALRCQRCQKLLTIPQHRLGPQSTGVDPPEEPVPSGCAATLFGLAFFGLLYAVRVAAEGSWWGGTTLLIIAGVAVWAGVIMHRGRARIDRMRRDLSGILPHNSDDETRRA